MGRAVIQRNVTASKPTRSSNEPRLPRLQWHMGISDVLDWNDGLRVGARGSICLPALTGTAVCKVAKGSVASGSLKFLSCGPDEWKRHGDPPASGLSGVAAFGIDTHPGYIICPHKHVYRASSLWPRGKTAADFQSIEA